MSKTLSEKYPLNETGKLFFSGWLESAFGNLDVKHEIVELIPNEHKRNVLRQICKQEIERAYKAASEYGEKHDAPWSKAFTEL